MTTLKLAAKNLLRRPIRSGLPLLGLTISMATLCCLLSFGEGYGRGLRAELDRMGMQLMVVPLGCPYDAAARVLKGRSLDVSLPGTAIQAVRSDPSVAVASPVCTAAIARRTEGRTDLWVGIDESARALKPWWRLTAGSAWFRGADSVILGAEAAATEMRRPGDRLYSPETGRTFTVCGVLDRSGTSDDSLFFVPLATAQTMFGRPGRLTAIAVRLKDPALVTGAAERLQKIPGAQVVTLTEMIGTFLNLVGAARTLILAITMVAVAVGGLSVFNTMMAAVLERTREIGVLRAVGLSRAGVFGLLWAETAALCAAGIAAAVLGARLIETWLRARLPYTPSGALMHPDADLMALCLLGTLVLGSLAALLPAWRAARLSPATAIQTIGGEV